MRSLLELDPVFDFMVTSDTQRVFIDAQFAVHYRQVRRFRWQTAARPEHSLLLVISGPVEYQVEESMGTLASGGVIMIDPGASAEAHGNNVESISIALSSAYVLDYASQMDLTKSGAFITFRKSIVEFDERLSRLAGDLRDELKLKERGQELTIGALIRQIAVLLLRHHLNIRRSDQLEFSRAGVVDRRIRRAVELMHSHLERDLPLKEIAEAAYLSPFHFSRLFKKLTGASPHSYLANLRASRAQTLLADTDLSVLEISARVGYASSSHFTKAFRQATGMTPREFRSALVRHG